MLLAVEGGGLFSSSASGYSKGLTLLLLGLKCEEKPMRVSPWNQYHLVGPGSDSDSQLASGRGRGCTGFVCFGGTPAEPEPQSPLKVGPDQHQNGPLQVSSAPGKGKGRGTVTDDGVTGIALKSSLKKQQQHMSNCGDREGMKDDDLLVPTEARRVRWTDACGGELTAILEFESSEASGSDEELGGRNEGSCSCSVM